MVLDSGLGRMAIAFEIDNITCRYPGGTVPVLLGIKAEIPVGARVGLLGRSGVGKSTLLSVLGLLWEGQLEEGTVRYYPGAHDGFVDYRSVYDAGKRAKIRLCEFGFLFQSSNLVPHLTCAENIALPLLLRGGSRSRWWPRVQHLLSLVEHTPGELTKLADRLGPYSGGQTRRLALLRAVCHNPRVLFADEPFSNLDSASIGAVYRILEAWHENRLHPQDPPEPRTLIVAGHDLECLWQLCDRFLVVCNGGNLLGNRVFSKEEITFDRLSQLIHGESLTHDGAESL